MFVSGRLEVKEWEDGEGQKRHSTELVAQELQLLRVPVPGIKPSRDEPVEEMSPEEAPF